MAVTSHLVTLRAPSMKKPCTPTRTRDWWNEIRSRLTINIWAVPSAGTSPAGSTCPAASRNSGQIM